ncbi:hypothetical protein [Pararhodobacter sp. SW119]|uniref:hypothetical protein n=1 Tax=Pararhodobacter sp. SW119 TaxID=2780075 RepID=UPI001AE0681A|nr:hypothetical protein [Pararhodobacter sp. SW119]
MSLCDPGFNDPLRFPQRPTNRPGLDRIAYRIGEYPDMVAAMLRHIDGEVALAGWTHRGADDPGIALLESVGILGDILTFYQEHYANEAFLRTATWRESVAGLVRLLGYRLSPGLGGHATLAVELKPAAGKVVVPAGFAFKAELAGQDQPAEFQTDAELVAWPHLSRFHLYRPRSYAASAPVNSLTLEIESVAGNSSPASVEAAELKKGDRILLVPSAPAWSSSATAGFSAQDSSQVLKIAEVSKLHDRTLLTFESRLARSWSLPLTAYRLGRSWRHFGHAAPPSYSRPTPATGNVTGATTLTTKYLRHVGNDHDCINTSISFSLPGTVLPLDQEAADLTPRTRVAVETRIRRAGTMRDCLLVRRISELRTTTLGFGPQTGPSTLLTLDGALVTHGTNKGDEADIRDYRIHEITSPQLRLRPAASASGGAFGSGNAALAFHGTRTEVRRLAGRRLSLKHADGRAIELTCINEESDFTGSDAVARMWALSVDAPPAPFLRTDFDEAVPKVTVWGNTVSASQGKAVETVVLGNGDARAAFQTFALPKPVTHHLHPGADPAEVPELEVHVAGRRVDRVSSLHGEAGDNLVYVLRQNDAGEFHIQFGDGKTGARLPSGRGNVTATFRTGSGARGTLAEGASPTGSRIEGVAKLQLPGVIAGGAEPESAGKARMAAPGRVQGLGRIVSLADYESELLSIPGVSRVRAAWDMLDGAPGVLLRVLLESGRESEYDSVRDSIYAFQRCRGSNRFELKVDQAVLRQVHLDLRFAFDPALLEEDVTAAVTRLLAPMDRPDASANGVFALTARTIAEPEYASRIEGRVQSVAGVRWARVQAFARLAATPPGTPPDELSLPRAPRPRHAKVAAGALELLQLHSAHLTLSAAPADPGEACT